MVKAHRIRHASCQHAFFSTCIINLIFKKDHAGLRVKCLVVTIIGAGLTISCTIKCLVVTMLRAGLTISCTVKCLVVTMLRVGLSCLKPHSTYNLNLQRIALLLIVKWIRSLRQLGINYTG